MVRGKHFPALTTQAAMTVDRCLAAAMPFLVVATLAIIAGGAVAAAVAHAPSQKWVWMVAYLVLVVGVAQICLGAGQSLLVESVPGLRVRVAELLLFNVGNAGVIVGTVSSWLLLVWAGTVLLAAALVMFLYATWAAAGSWLVYAYRTVLLLVGAGAVAGVVIATVRTA